MLTFYTCNFKDEWSRYSTSLLWRHNWTDSCDGRDTWSRYLTMMDRGRATLEVDSSPDRLWAISGWWKFFWCESGCVGVSRRELIMFSHPTPPSPRDIKCQTGVLLGSAVGWTCESGEPNTGWVWAGGSGWERWRMIIKRRKTAAHARVCSR